ncbi:MAG: sigma-70 family RNA polymerase sigma factor [Balneolaceae bacterium]
MCSSDSSISKAEFTRLYERYYGDVFRFLCTYSKSRAEVKDWTQDVFIKLWVKRHRVDFFHASFKSYLIKTARNHALKTLYKHKRYSEWLDEHLTQLIRDREQLSNESDESLVSFWSSYDKTISGLPSRALETWRLSRDEGLTYPEIAEVMGVTVKTVETQISNVLALLREEFNVEGRRR